jgi:hypothetical protein
VAGDLSQTWSSRKVFAAAQERGKDSTPGIECQSTELPHRISIRNRFVACLTRVSMPNPDETLDLLCRKHARRGSRWEAACFPSPAGSIRQYAESVQGSPPNNERRVLTGCCRRGGLLHDSFENSCLHMSSQRAEDERVDGRPGDPETGEEFSGPHGGRMCSTDCHTTQNGCGSKWKSSNMPELSISSYNFSRRDPYLRYR